MKMNNTATKVTEKRRIQSPTKQKILLLLQAGLVLGLRRPTLGGQLRIVRQLAKEWRRTDRAYLYRCLREFREERLVGYQEAGDGTIKVVLTEQGKRRVLRFNISQIVLKKSAVWDGKWRVVLFDIPEKKRWARDALRRKLRELGFHEWQKSVFVYPHPCRDEIDFVVEFFEIRPYVRYAELLHPTNEVELKLRFNL